MTERQLSKALLQLDTAPPASTLDPRHLAENIIGRDRRKLRWLTGLAAVFWTLTAAGLVWFSTVYLMFVAPRLQAYGAGRAQLENDWNDWARAGDLAAKSLLACIFALLLAAVCTILLVLHSRRATLRQVMVGLVEISKQLKDTQPPPASGAT
jgi:ABC-type Fe3+ transport system permease subunit